MLNPIGSTGYIPIDELEELSEQLDCDAESLPASAGCPAGHLICDGECSENQSLRARAARIEAERLARRAMKGAA